MNPPEILIGCPVLHREWMAREWVTYAWSSADAAGLTPAFLIVARADDPTVRVMQTTCDDLGVDIHVVSVDEPRCQDQRIWSPERYERMAELRNQLLEQVRTIAPPLFLSLDSDILLHSEAITRMVALIETGYDAVGSKCFLEMQGCGTNCPNYADLSRDGGLRRSNQVAAFKVQILMAIKLMTPPAYNVNYRGHLQGEDTGWSLNCAEAGLRFGWDGTVASKHVMAPHELLTVDERVGF